MRGNYIEGGGDEEFPPLQPSGSGLHMNAQSVMHINVGGQAYVKEQQVNATSSPPIGPCGIEEHDFLHDNFPPSSNSTEAFVPQNPIC